MSYSQITYGDATHTFRLPFDDEWDPAEIATVKIQLADEAGTELLAAQSATLFTATTLNGAVSSGTLVATLTAAALEPGDIIEIADSDAGPPERRTVDFYNATTKVVNVTEEWEQDHTTGAAVAGCWATYEADISDSDDFAKGAIVVATWSAYDGAGTPTYQETPIKEEFQVGAFKLGIINFWNRFNAKYPTEYKVAQKRDTKLLERDWLLDFKDELWKIDKQADRIINQRSQDRGFIRFARLQIVGSQGDATEYERKVAMEDWIDWYSRERDHPRWQDKDQDGAIDEAETSPSVPVFDVGYY